MSGSVNKVIIIGNLATDVETRNFQGGGRVASFRVATSEQWKDKQSGERKELAQFHSVAVFNEPSAKFAEQYLRKGSKIYLEGQLETRSWEDQSGQKKYATEIVLRPYSSALIGLDKRDDAGQPDPHKAQSPASGGYSADDFDSIPF